MPQPSLAVAATSVSFFDDEPPQGETVAPEATTVASEADPVLACLKEQVRRNNYGTY